MIDAHGPSLWSAQQYQWLSALGHTVYLRADSEARIDQAQAPVTAIDEQPSAPDFHAAAVAPPPRTTMPATETVRTPTPVEAAAETHRTPARAPRSSGLPDRLYIALIRASGCNPNAPGAEAIFAQWPSTAELRGNPAAKRALWPRLRALRKASQA